MKSIFFGGPWYRSVHPGLVISAMKFAVESPAYGYRVENLGYADGMLDFGRNLLMRDAIQSGADWFVSVDADVTFDGRTKQICEALEGTRAAIVGAPLELPDGMSNVIDLNQDHVTWPCKREGSVSKIGFGFVAFRLGWYVKNWPDNEVFFQTRISRVGRGYLQSGEDYNHCNRVRELGGIVYCAPSIGATHELSRRVER